MATTKYGTGFKGEYSNGVASPFDQSKNGTANKSIFESVYYP
jgi:hypothetical protein